MITFQKKSVKIISVLIALVFVGSVVALALTQFGSGMASAAGNSNVGIVDMREVYTQHPQAQSGQAELQQAYEDIQKDLQEKTANMSTDQEKEDYMRQCQERFQQKQKEVFEPIQKSCEDAVKSVADAKGLTVVVDKSAVVYGGTDITQDVVKKVSK